MSTLDHVVRTLRLAFPVMLARAGILVMVAVDTAMTGHYGATDLAYYGLGLAPQIVILMTGIGLLIGTMVLTAQADGAGELSACGRIWRLGLMLAATIGVALLFVCQTGPLFYTAVGQSADFAAGAGAVMAMFGLGIPALFLHAVTSFFLEGISRPLPGMLVMLGANIANAFLNWVFIFGNLGAEALGAEGAALATTIVRWLMFLSLAVYVLAMKDHSRYGLRGPITDAAGILQRLLAIGLPLAFAHGLEAGAFASLTLFAGLLGTVTLGGFQVAMNLVAIVFMLALGFSTAASVRVGNAVGRGDALGTRRAGWVAVALAVAVMATFTVVLAAFPRQFAAIYSNDPLIVASAIPTITVAAMVLIVDGAQGVLVGALRGLADVAVPSLAYLLALWGLMVPLAYVYGVQREGGGPALMFALFVGLTVLTVMLGFRFAQVTR